MRSPLLTLLFLPASAIACSCGGDWSLEAAYANAERVAVVRIAAAKLHTERRRVTQFSGTDPDGREVVEEVTSIRATGQVIEQLKGRKAKNVTLIATLPSNGCYQELVMGETYLVFWHQNKAAHNACNPQPLLRTVPADILQRWRSAP